MVIQTRCHQLYIPTLDRAHQRCNSGIGLRIYFDLFNLYKDVEMVKTASFACKMEWCPPDAIFGIWACIKFKHSLHYFDASHA